MKSKVKLVRVGDLCEQIRGVSYGKADASSEQGVGLVPILRANNITDSGVTYDNLVYVPASCVSAKQKLKKNDILVAASSGSISVVGKTAQCIQDFDGAFGAFCKVLRPNDKVASGYFSHYFQTPSYRHTISNLAAGANINNLKNEHLNDLIIPLPPLDEQRRIAAILDKADAIRRKRREAIRLLDDFLRATFLDMFGDPVTNPKGWEQLSLNEAGALVQIGPFGSLLHQKDYVSDGIPLVNPKHIINGHIEASGKETITESKAETLNHYLLKDGDVIMARRGEMGRCAVVDLHSARMLCGTGSLFIRPNSNNLTPIYLSRVIASSSMKQQLEQLAQGVTMANLNGSIIESLTICIPPIKLQQKYSAIVRTVEKQKETLMRQASDSESLFSSFQSRAFKGRL